MATRHARSLGWHSIAQAPGSSASWEAGRLVVLFFFLSMGWFFWGTIESTVSKKLSVSKLNFSDNTIMLVYSRKPPNTSSRNSPWFRICFSGKPIHCCWGNELSPMIWTEGTSWLFLFSVFLLTSFLNDHWLIVMSHQTMGIWLCLKRDKTPICIQLSSIVFSNSNGL